MAGKRGGMAKRFHFNLERVLNIREQFEERAKMELAKAMAAVHAQERELSRLINEKEAREASIAQNPNLTQGELWLWQAYRRRLEDDIQAARVRLEELVEVRERCRRTLVTRSKDKKLLEKLKSNKAERHALEENLAEQKENDELASMHHRPPAL